MTYGNNLIKGFGLSQQQLSSVIANVLEFFRGEKGVALEECYHLWQKVVGERA